MIPVELLKPARLFDLKEGGLFVTAAGVSIVAGRAGKVDVFTMLNPSQQNRLPFEFFVRGEQPRRGFVYPKVHLEVDETTVKVVESEYQLEIGQLASFADGIALYAYGRKNSRSLEEERCLVELAGTFNEEQEPMHLVSFSRWRIVVGEGEKRHVLFTHDDAGASAP